LACPLDQKERYVPRIELLLQSRLIEDALSSVLTNAGFAVFHEPTQGDNETIVVTDFDGCKDPGSVSAHQSRGVKIVALTSKAASLKIGLNEITPLSGVLTYDLSASAFVRSLLLISAGERVFPHDLSLGRKSAAPEPQSSGVHLSPREKEMLSHLVAGHSNKKIGNDLGITEATVKVHLKSVLRKIRCENRTQAAIWALANLPELDNHPLRVCLSGGRSALRVS
jgi:two-component system, NarL family, nitrate/nitrite response regulator NarL